jgi:hypothetical protein
VEYRLQTRLQISAGDFLGDAIRYRRNSQRSRATIALRNIHAPHRRRKVTPRGHSIPKLVEAVRKISLEPRNRLSIYSCRSLVGLHRFEGFPDFPFGDVERLCLVREFLPLPVDSRPRLNNAAPSVRLHYRAFHPSTSCSVPVLRVGTLILAVCAAWISPLASERQVLTFRTKAWLRVAPPTCRMPFGQAPGSPRADPGGMASPRFRHRLIRFRHFIGGLLALASLNLACRSHRSDVSATLTTVALNDSSLRWLEACT